MAATARLFIENLSIGMCLQDCGSTKRLAFSFYIVILSVKLHQYDQRLLCIYLPIKYTCRCENTIPDSRESVTFYSAIHRCYDF